MSYPIPPRHHSHDYTEAELAEIDLEAKRLHAISQKVSAVMNGVTMGDALGVFTSMCIVAAREIGMDKMELQKLIVGMWDHQDYVNSLNSKAAKS